MKSANVSPASENQSPLLLHTGASWRCLYLGVRIPAYDRCQYPVTFPDLAWWCWNLKGLAAASKTARLYPGLALLQG
jgi:hypothetical protein